MGEPIKDQSFKVKFENFGDCEFISTVEKVDNRDHIHFYIKSTTVIFELKYNMEDENAFYDMKAVSFKDLNSDGLKDIVIIVDYTTGFGYMGAIPISQVLVFTQKESNFFEDESIENRAYSFPYRILTISDVLTSIKIDPNSGLGRAWNKLPVGIYTQFGTYEFAGPTINIEKASAESITFSLSDYHKNANAQGIKNSSVITGIIKSSKATPSYSEMIFRDGNYELSFDLISSTDIYVRDNGVTYFGLDVNVTGVYSKVKK